MSPTTVSLTLGVTSASPFVFDRLLYRDERYIPELHVLKAIDEDLPVGQRLHKIRVELVKDSPHCSSDVIVVLHTNNPDLRFVRRVIRAAFGSGVAIALD
ncbi:hypothetical protein [Thermoleptolyngbya sp. M55_K2018_002]|uniref:hypothetical protein n=1 Tax=Thermoleptolyngbya sp. M55_K2018_002 TaxID=2747808 RepID=UPI0019E9A2A8|nr:hypothetical protein [Thermoleptolyngbya sp. M55_K2018_002]HIK42135.1 hypothetical protein [Thermoleptolyngbya sp. M55_K2018_002]